MAPLPTMFKQVIHEKNSENGEELNEKLPPANQRAASPNVLSLRQWIKQAIQFVENVHVCGQQSALSSAEYLESAIKIAISLSEQISLAETLDLQYGISDKLDVLPISAAYDWAGHVTVHLNVAQQKVEATKANSPQLEDQAKGSFADTDKQEADGILDLFSDDEIARERALERSHEGYLKSE
jgi:hypothetical protein